MALTRNRTRQKSEIRLHGWADAEKIEPMLRPIVKFIVDYVRLMGLLVQYFLLHVEYFYLLCCKFLLKLAGAALIEAVKIEYCIKSMSMENRVIFAACVAVSIYVLALVMLIRF